ncbi:hypothetical protein [Alteriqipengyuania lutimaris]|uniref:META domain-containing protein n=1 Tax=Alteriqipengyuania lutimaris TaxID=1538146 RepID=A0A395LHS3_9SPHN|nr:hypothetical protein [Alteriqipengyuania lutimaris]MBB3034641.1 hypothetical protein [Alteriqipengyuania lutimaris]RDS76488.1 hypothetical protein DL238_01970 [Alteriqipengyuania lutimaris]
MRATILIAALLAACTPQAGPSGTQAGQNDGAASDAAQASADRALAPTTLAGEWRVAGIDGEAFDESYGLALSADEEEIWWEPRCAGQSIRYRIADGRFEAVPPPPLPAPEPGAEPAPANVVCLIGLPERLPEVMTAIRAADRIERTSANGIRLSGEGHSLTLFSQ